MNKKRLPLLVFRCVALGLGLGVLTLAGMHKIDTDDALLAVTCLAACSLGENAKSKSDE